jgi:hypothetical protein
MPGPLRTRWQWFGRCSDRALRTGLRVRRRDGLRLRGALLTQEDREDRDRPDRKELALPVLEGFVPELGRREVLEQGNSFAPMCDLFVAVLPRTPNPVHDKRGGEEECEGDKE